MQLPPQHIAGLCVMVTIDDSVQDVEGKLSALRRGLDLVGANVPMAFVGMPPLQVFLGKDVACAACWQPERRGGATSLFLGDRSMFSTNRVAREELEFALGKRRASTAQMPPGDVVVWGYGEEGKRGVADQIYDDKRKSRLDPSRLLLAMQGKYDSTKIDAKAAAMVVHELGHLIHELNAPDQFWYDKSTGSPRVPASIANCVSSYAHNNNYCEFVAEVFTGLVHGRAYPPEVLVEYARHGGPRVFAKSERRTP